MTSPDAEAVEERAIVTLKLEALPAFPPPRDVHDMDVYVEFDRQHQIIAALMARLALAVESLDSAMAMYELTGLETDTIKAIIAACKEPS